LDGKHILIDPPINSGALFHNYKNSFSIILMALLDAHQRFIYVDVGTNGRVGDAGVWAKCSLRSALESNSIHLPEPRAIPFTTIKMPFVIVADDAFPLTEHTMKGYSQKAMEGRLDRRIFNYR
jgi:hypothetical protein